ncbi:MAG TPA: HAD-IA family hydrolase [Rhizomicrobium sp.]|jgi:putative hydrolase of the HAD superfamily
MSEIRAVIWDFGGVFTSSPFDAFARYEREKGLPADFLRRVNAANHLDNAWARFERAEIDLEEFDRAFAEEARAFGHPVPGREVIALLAGEIRPEMIEALRHVHARFKTGCITNNVPSSEERSGRALHAREIMELFDHVIESSRYGLRKPDPRIYAMMCEALGVAPQACVYLDDLGVNLKPARAMGMTTIKVETASQAIAELENVLGMRLGVAPSAAGACPRAGHWPDPGGGTSPASGGGKATSEN